VIWTDSAIEPNKYSVLCNGGSRDVLMRQSGH
jgi:hypothetical protein